MIKAVLLDFFGVLYPDTFWGLADKYLPERDDEVQADLHELIRKVDLDLVDKNKFWNEAAQLFKVDLVELETAKNAMGGVDDRLLDLCKDLKQKGIKTGVISNAGSGFVERGIGDDYQDYFDVIVSSGDSGVMKPDREIYAIACDKLGFKPEDCIFFDDIQRNVNGAIAAGLHAELYSGFNKCKKLIETDIK